MTYEKRVVVQLRPTQEVGSFASRAASQNVVEALLAGDAVRVLPGRVLRARDGQAEFFAECAADESSDAVCLAAGRARHFGERYAVGSLQEGDHRALL